MLWMLWIGKMENWLPPNGDELGRRFARLKDLRGAGGPGPGEGKKGVQRLSRFGSADIPAQCGWEHAGDPGCSPGCCLLLCEFAFQELRYRRSRHQMAQWKISRSYPLVIRGSIS